MKRARVLVVDDKESFLTLFRRIVPADVDIMCVSSGTRAIEILAAERFDVVVSDIRMPGLDGMTLLQRIRDAGIDAEIVLMTAYGTIADAVRAMKYGAADYLTKPFDPDDAVAAIEQALARRRSRATSRESGPATLVGQGDAMKRVFELIDRAGESNATVLVSGESGTGKELVASAIHAKSRRSNKRLVAVNCGALPAGLVESELFGQVRGTLPEATQAKRGLFELASGGTLFLDEVGELPLPIQLKLTRCLQRRTIRKVGATDEQIVDVRVIAATNLDLRRAASAQRFREDLLYQLSVLSIRMPPLRERREDIPLLTEQLLARANVSGDRMRRLSSEALACLASYDWPGNVRQLENALARAVAITVGDEIGLDALPSEIRGSDLAPRSGAPLSSLPYREAIAAERERATCEYIIALLREVHGNVTQAAERAGVERESFHRLMKRHGIRSEDYRAK